MLDYDCGKHKDVIERHKMKKTLVAAFAALMIAGAAQAADAVDLPGVVVPDYAPVAQNYVGVSVGQSTGDDRHNSVGFTAGRQLNENVAVEGQYERAFNRKGSDTTTDRVSGNVLVGKRFGSVTPYALGGVGYEWRDSAEDRAVYALGGGAKLHVSEKVDLDARYRYINSFDSDKRGEDNVFTLGVNVKF